MSVQAKYLEPSVVESTARRGWQQDAECRDADPADFALEFGEGGIPERAREAAADFCDQCPVLADCRAAGDARKEPGLWGGEWREIHDSKPRYRKTPLIPVETLLARRAS